jgi:hypothetical protein
VPYKAPVSDDFLNKMTFTLFEYVLFALSARNALQKGTNQFFSPYIDDSGNIECIGSSFKDIQIDDLICV